MSFVYKADIIEQNFNEVELSYITYDVYCKLLDNSLDEGILDTIKGLKISGQLVKIFKDLKSTLNDISQKFQLGINDIILAFKQRDVFKLLKSVGFNIKLLFKSINALSTAVRQGLFSIFEELANSKVMLKIKSGAMKVDEILDKYPLLKKIGGIVVAGLLLYIWLNMTFIGDLDYDFNFSDLVAALKGSFSIADLFTSPSGLMLIALFGTGSMLGLSVPWLGKSIYNLTLAIIYTGIVKAKEHLPELRSKLITIKQKMR